MHRRALAHLRRADPVLARVIDTVGPCRYTIRDAGSHFDHIVRAIVYQQLSGKAAATIHGRIVALFDGTPPTPDQLMGVPDEQLRAAGLSRQKITYMKDLAQRAHSGDLPVEALHELGDDAVIEALTRVKGIGLWTAQMFLIFRLGRPDVLPDLDLGIRKAIQRAYALRRLPNSERVHKIGAVWAPYRTIASWYLWRSIDAGTPRSRPAKSTSSKKRSTPRARVAKHTVKKGRGRR